MQNVELLKALAVTAEVCGASISNAAAQVFVAELSLYPEHTVFAALRRLNREHKGQLTLASIIERIDDGRPSADEAWAMVPRAEHDTAVLTSETLEALKAAQPLLNEGDQIAARMAFKAAYARVVAKAKDEGRGPAWIASLGWDGAGRVGPLADAVEQGKLTAAMALGLVSGSEREALAVAVKVQDAITGPLAPSLASVVKSTELVRS